MIRAAWFAVVVLTLPPPSAPERRETVGGAYSRAMNELELVNREQQLERVNEGAQGRKNALRTNARQSEVPPLGTPPLSGDW